MSKERIKYLSRLKSFACLAVVILHTLGMAMGFSPDKDTARLIFSIRTLTLWAVPCFIMATGALLLDENRELGLKKLFSKLILRMVLALVIFTFLFKCFDALLIDKNFELGEVLDFTGKSLLYNYSWEHMWYLYLMIALYLMMPAYKAAAKAMSSSTLNYIIAVMFVMLSLLPAVYTLFLAEENGQSAELRIVIYISKVFPLFLFAGFAIAKDKLKIPLIVSGPVELACAIVMPILTDHCVKERDMALYSIINEYHFPITVLGAAALFALFKAFDKIDLGAADKFFAQVEKCSFGIYLLHMVFLKLVFAVWGFDPFDHGGLIMVFLISFAVFLVTFIVVRLLRFIPFVNKVI